MQKRTLWLSLVATSLLLVAGCVSVPAGPTVLVLPGQQKSFDLFQYDDIACRQYAQSLVAPAGQEAVNNAAGTAAVATVIGAAAGAIIGSASGQAGQGAAIGAGTGLLFGSAAGGNTAYLSSYELQRRYNVAYMQCMYARGNQLPGQAVYRQAPAASRAPGGPQSAYPPANTPAPAPSSQSPVSYPPPNTPAPAGVSSTRR